MDGPVYGRTITNVWREAEFRHVPQTPNYSDSKSKGRLRVHRAAIITSTCAMTTCWTNEQSIDIALSGNFQNQHVRVVVRYILCVNIANSVWIGNVERTLLGNISSTFTAVDELDCAAETEQDLVFWMFLWRGIHLGRLPLGIDLKDAAQLMRTSWVAANTSTLSYLVECGVDYSVTVLGLEGCVLFGGSQERY